LAAGLRALGKEVRVIIPSSLPPRYASLDPDRQVMEFQPHLAANVGQVDAIIVVDTGTWNQLGKVGEWMKTQNVPKLVIDHHRTQDDLGAVRLVDISAEACGRLIHEALIASGVMISPEIARLLFVAVSMDTGWFHHSNVSAATFVLAAELTRVGAEPDRLYQELYDSNTLARQRLSGHVLQSLELLRAGTVCHAAVTLADYARLGARPTDTEDLVNLTLTVQGVEVGLLFLEQPVGGTKVSLRSRGEFDCSKLAERFGGGGHAAAAGVIVKDPLPSVRENLLHAVFTELSK
jgi:phosphoesterase RecJ-like protein